MSDYLARFVEVAHKLGLDAVLDDDSFAPRLTINRDFHIGTACCDWENAKAVFLILDALEAKGYFPRIGRLDLTECPYECIVHAPDSDGSGRPAATAYGDTRSESVIRAATAVAEVMG